MAMLVYDLKYLSNYVCMEIQGPQMMNPNDFADPLTFPLAPPAGQTISVTT